MSNGKVALIILDGYGIGEPNAATPSIWPKRR